MFLGYTKITSKGHFFSNKGFKSGYKIKNKATELDVFKGREAKLNLAIFYILAKEESPLAVWNILGHVTERRGFKRTKYAVVNARVKALETQGYLKKTGVREKKPGGETNLYEVTVNAELAMALYSESIETILKELDEPAAVTMLGVIVSRQRQQNLIV